MSRKKLNVDAVVNELKGQSVFFRKEHSPTDKRAVDRKREETERPERVERPERPVRKEKRETRRHSFEFYRDQVDTLHELRLKSMKRGELKSLSAMVREAVDEYVRRNL